MSPRPDAALGGIHRVAVLGAGTMGIGIAAAAADAGAEVLLLDMTSDGPDRSAVARAGFERMQAIRPAAFDDPGSAARIQVGNFADDLPRISDCDWIVEAIIEEIGAKRDLWRQVERVRAEGAVLSSNTSGIPLREIIRDMPARLRQDLVITHFFNPVKLMKLVEVVGCADTRPDAVIALSRFLAEGLKKGVVRAKDTVNFIANRIGCLWMFNGLNAAEGAILGGMTPEAVDALLAKPCGLPPTALLGLMDLVGMDVLALVGRNLEQNLPPGDWGRPFTRLPPLMQAMVDRGQVGRKAGGGFYRQSKAADGSRVRETFDLAQGTWRPERPAVLGPPHTVFTDLLFAATPEGRFAWTVMAPMLRYAADLVPEISDDLVGIDRAMRWGFAWQMGPFEMLDALGPERVAQRFAAEGTPVPVMLGVLREARATTFYRAGREYLGRDGRFHPIP
ncbi:MAG: 3-hydroxyacyl-CoA dehydrogenase [Alphaproteobacteria bacterium]|nr:3-hydroxyacyl-CoA dehydrogenase [Alphaproteobacteria bacterium]